MGGANQISHCMAKELGQQVKLQSPVVNIDQTGVLVAVETLDKQTYMVSELLCAQGVRYMNHIKPESFHLPNVQIYQPLIGWWQNVDSGRH